MDLSKLKTCLHSAPCGQTNPAVTKAEPNRTTGTKDLMVTKAVTKAPTATRAASLLRQSLAVKVANPGGNTGGQTGGKMPKTVTPYPTMAQIGTVTLVLVSSSTVAVYPDIGGGNFRPLLNILRKEMKRMKRIGLVFLAIASVFCLASQAASADVWGGRILPQ